jgi:hypothetical protein
MALRTDPNGTYQFPRTDSNGTYSTQRYIYGEKNMNKPIVRFDPYDLIRTPTFALGYGCDYIGCSVLFRYGVCSPRGVRTFESRSDLLPKSKL